MQIKVTPLNVDCWNGPFPGDGVYKCMNGIAWRANGMTMVWNSSGWENLVSSAEQASAGGSGLATVDIHRLIDQVADLTKRPA